MSKSDVTPSSMDFSADTSARFRDGVSPEVNLAEENREVDQTVGDLKVSDAVDAAAGRTTAREPSA